MYLVVVLELPRVTPSVSRSLITRSQAHHVQNTADHAHRHNHSSSSSDSLPLPKPSCSTATMKAHCEQIPSKAPTITTGELNPEVLCLWELGCKQYFHIKDIDADKQVSFVAWNLLDMHIQDWYGNNSDRFDAMNFKDFIAKVCKAWLPVDWDSVL